MSVSPHTRISSERPVGTPAPRRRQAVRWYVMTLPTSRRGDYRGNPGRGLQAELERRLRQGEPAFEYYAPLCVEAREVDGTWVNTHKPLLLNYVFIHASEAEILRIKQFQPQYNFLPRIRDTHEEYYPYLTDQAMEELQRVACTYLDELPVCSLSLGQPVKGDRIRITAGKFKGIEATVAIQPGGGRKTIAVRIEGCMYVPLLSVNPDQYEIIALNTENRHLYTRMNSDRLPDGLHKALQRYHSTAGVSVQDEQLAQEVLRQYEQLQMESDIMRSKLYALLLPAYTILGQREKRDQLIATIHRTLPRLKAEQARALLWVTLYGCTNDKQCYYNAHEIVAPWRQETALKKSKERLLHRLQDYDRWLGHA